MKIPTPMTLEMTMAAASKGPRRRSRDGEAAPSTGLSLVVDEAPRHRILADLRPLGRAVLGEELDGRVDEHLALHHFLAGLIGARVAQVRLDAQRLGGGA